VTVVSLCIELHGVAAMTPRQSPVNRDSMIPSGHVLQLSAQALNDDVKLDSQSETDAPSAPHIWYQPHHAAASRAVCDAKRFALPSWQL
jgi:hypothetical protein